MFVNDCLNVNAEGHLTIGGCDTVELAKKYATTDDAAFINGILGTFIRSREQDAVPRD